MKKKFLFVVSIVSAFFIFLYHSIVQAIGLLPAPIAGIGVAGIGKGIAKNMAGKVIANINLLVQFLILFLLVLSVILLFIVFFKWIAYRHRKKIIKLQSLLVELHSILILFKDINSFKQDERLAIDNTRKELVGMAKDGLKQKLFKNKFGKRIILKMTKYFDKILENKIDVEDQIKLVESWIKFLK